MAIWASRDSSIFYVIRVWSGRPLKHHHPTKPGNVDYHRDEQHSRLSQLMLGEFCPELFKKYTGIDIKPGELIKLKPGGKLNFERSKK